jgi:hypothetical protein
MRIFRFGVPVVLFALMFASVPSVSMAACTGPAGVGGDIIFNSDYSVMQYCDDTAWVGFPKTDQTPDAIVFTPLTNQSAASLVTSNTVSISGLDGAVSVTISGDGGPQFRINGGAWGTAGSVSDGDTLQLRMTTGAASTQYTATVAVGMGSPVQWEVATSGADTTPDAFTFSDVTGAVTNTLTTSSAITITGINSATSVTVSGDGSPQISINGGAWVTSGSISNGQTLAVRLTSSASDNTTLSATVVAGGVSDQWDVTTAVADCATLWTLRTNPSSSWRSIAYGNGVFVAGAGNNGGPYVMTSPDGVTWTASPEATALSWVDIAYGAGLFVALVGDGSGYFVKTSPDGITWTARTSPTNQWQSITYGGGQFVAVAVAGTNRVMTSPDGITWTARSASQANPWYDVIYAGGMFVAVTYSGTNRVMTSPNGITWTNRTAAEANNWLSVAYGDGLFVAVASTGTNRVMTSPDGITWTARPVTEASGWRSVTYGNGAFVAVASSGTNRAMTSLDGINWTILPGNTYGEAVAFGENTFVSVRSSQVRTADASACAI